MMKKFLTLIAVILFSIFSFSKVLVTVKEDIDNDKTIEVITLEGTPVSSLFSDDFEITIKNGKFQKNVKLNFGGYNPEIKLFDFDGDSIKDILVTAYSGGSGNYQEYFIYSIKNGILLNNDLSINLTAEFMDNFKALISYNGNFTYLDLSDRKDEYIEMGLYNEFGQFTGDYKKLFIGGISKIETIDFFNDNIYELEGSISVSGAYHADRIGYLHFVYSVKNRKVIWLEISKVLYTGF